MFLLADGFWSELTDTVWEVYWSLVWKVVEAIVPFCWGLVEDLSQVMLEWVIAILDACGYDGGSTWILEHIPVVVSVWDSGVGIADNFIYAGVVLDGIRGLLPVAMVFSSWRFAWWVYHKIWGSNG